MTMLDRLKIMLDITDGSQDNKLSVILDTAKDTILDATGRDVLPDRLQSECVELAVIIYNRQGTEGNSSRSEGGISESYIDGLPQHIIKRLKAYPKKARMMKIASENTESDGN